MAALSSDSAAQNLIDPPSVTPPPFDLDEALSFPTVHFSSSNNLQRSIPRPISPDWYPFVLAFPAVNPGKASRCTVCMESFGSSGKGGRRIPCGHVYHADCIATWLAIYYSCPLCRLKVSSEYRANIGFPPITCAN